MAAFSSGKRHRRAETETTPIRGPTSFARARGGGWELGVLLLLLLLLLSLASSMSYLVPAATSLRGSDGTLKQGASKVCQLAPSNPPRAAPCGVRAQKRRTETRAWPRRRNPPLSRYRISCKITHPLDRFSKLKHSTATSVTVPKRAALERSRRQLSENAALGFGTTLAAE